MRLLPRDERFFELLIDLSRLTAEAAGHLKLLFEAQPEERDTLVGIIKALEHRADDITHDVVTRIDRSFVTPLDREDIHALATKLDDILDHMNGIAQRVVIFRVEEPPPRTLELVAVVQGAVEALLAGVRLLGNRKPKAVMEACDKVAQFEKDGDDLYQACLGQLFVEPAEALHVLKWKWIYDALEDTLDSAEDVANVLESVAIKNG